MCNTRLSINAHAPGEMAPGSARGDQPKGFPVKAGAAGQKAFLLREWVQHRSHKLPAPKTPSQAGASPKRQTENLGQEALQERRPPGHSTRADAQS